MAFQDMVLKLILSVLLGGLVGMERETHGRPAGLRTHILVCTGSTLFTLCSYSIAAHGNDPGRMAAQIVTGIGFLGAGTIIQRGSAIRGLTTAASIWTVAAIGVAVAIGGNMLYLAAVSSVLVYGVLSLVAHIERYLLTKQEEKYLTVMLRGNQTDVHQVLDILTKFDVQLREIRSDESEDGLSRILRLRLRAGRNFNQTAIDTELVTAKNVISYNWEQT